MILIKVIVVLCVVSLIHCKHHEIKPMATYKVEPVSSAPISVLGEGPHWDIERQSLYFVDIYNNSTSILRYDYAENKTYSALIENETYPSFIIPVEGECNQFAVGLMRRVAIVEWDGKSESATVLRIALEVEKEAKFVNNRFNDAKADPTGRLYGGTMRREECGNIFDAADGALYKYARNEEVKLLVGKVGVSNGLAWNEKKRKFYYIDSCATNVREYDWDPKTGDIDNERVLISFLNGTERPSFAPDGMTIDAEGNLYVATFSGSKILKVNPSSGKVDLEINLPAEQITSVAFGGPNLDILYATSASMEMYKKQAPLGGSLFKITGLGAIGLPAAKVRL